MSTSGRPPTSRPGLVLVQGSLSARATAEARLFEAARVCRTAAGGDLEARLLPPEDDAAAAELFGAVNALLDTTDAFVRESTASLERVSQGSFTRRLLERGLGGSFRRAARAINAATRAMGVRSEALASLRARQAKLAAEVETTVGTLTMHVAAAAQELEASAASLASSAAHARRGVTEGAAAAEAARRSVAAVAEVSQELHATTRAIGERAARSSAIAGTAIDGVKRSETSTAAVAAASARIDDVAKIISAISAQTRLLALNAAVEAARAGASGKGFGVVATEVKSLAGETARATEDIASHLGQIQGATEGAVREAQAVGGVVQELYAVADDLDRAATSQASAARAIDVSIASAAGGAAEASACLGRVAEATTTTEGAASDVHGAARSLAELATRLSTEVASLLSELRADP